MDRISDASRWGIETEYVDALGYRRRVDPETLERVFQALSANKDPTPERDAIGLALQRAYQGQENAPRRVWALAVQLYGVRSRRNWGHGDFSDLAKLLDLAASVGASGIGLNPMHALFDDVPEQASPYSPNSRRFLNPLYIDVEAVPEFPGMGEAGLTEEIQRLRALNLVDYRGVAAAKLHALQLAYSRFAASGSAERRQAFERFRNSRGAALSRFAAFEVVRRRYSAPWWEWPSKWKTPDDAALEELRSTDGDAIAFVEFVQWIADDQLAACRARARFLELPIGLYLDVAVGVQSGGYDAWSEQDAFLHSLSIGAPPDLLNSAGQNWGLTGFNPFGLEKLDFAPFRDMLRASMRYAGAVRLDHVLGLNRLYFIPKGLPPDKGVYIRMPLEALLAVTAQESRSNECIVIGEDLGTVPDNFRERLADWGIWTYQVLMFERGPDGAFRAPQDFTQNALVAFNTHDLPTFSGWASGHDLKVKHSIAMDPGETEEERQQARAALRAALAAQGIAGDDFLAVAEYLAKTPARLLVISMEDLLAIRDQPNLPGTVRQHPNWLRRLPVHLEELETSETLGSIAKLMQAAGRGLKTPA
jgi:4-alpha-glucanotransferase